MNSSKDVRSIPFKVIQKQGQIKNILTLLFYIIDILLSEMTTSHKTCSPSMCGISRSLIESILNKRLLFFTIMTIFVILILSSITSQPNTKSRARALCHVSKEQIHPPTKRDPTKTKQLYNNNKNPTEQIIRICQKFNQ